MELDHQLASKNALSSQSLWLSVLESPYYPDPFPFIPLSSFIFIILPILTAGQSIFSVLADFSAISSSEFRDVRALLTAFWGEIFFPDYMISLDLATLG